MARQSRDSWTGAGGIAELGVEMLVGVEILIGVEILVDVAGWNDKQGAASEVAVET